MGKKGGSEADKETQIETVKRERERSDRKKKIGHENRSHRETRKGRLPI